LKSNTYTSANVKKHKLGEEGIEIAHVVVETKL